MAGDWEPPRLSSKELKTIAAKLRKGYMKAGFKRLFQRGKHLFLTHLRYLSAAELIEKMSDEQS